MIEDEATVDARDLRGWQVAVSTVTASLVVCCLLAAYRADETWLRVLVLFVGGWFTGMSIRAVADLERERRSLD